MRFLHLLACCDGLQQMRVVFFHEDLLSACVTRTSDLTFLLFLGLYFCEQGSPSMVESWNVPQDSVQRNRPNTFFNAALSSRPFGLFSSYHKRYSLSLDLSY